MIEILLVSFTNLILTLKYSVLTYNNDWNDNVKWNAFFSRPTVRIKEKL